MRKVGDTASGAGEGILDGVGGKSQRPNVPRVRDVEGAKLSLPVTGAKRSPEGPGPKGDARGAQNGEIGSGGSESRPTR